MKTDLKSPELLREEARIRSAYKERAKPAGHYSWFDPGTLFIVHEREKILLKRLRQQDRDPLAGSRFLEVGCGSGHWLREFIKWGVSPADVTGIDLRLDAISMASRLCPQGVTLQCSAGAR